MVLTRTLIEHLKIVCFLILLFFFFFFEDVLTVGSQIVNISRPACWGLCSRAAHLSAANFNSSCCLKMSALVFWLWPFSMDTSVGSYVQAFFSSEYFGLAL